MSGGVDAIVVGAGVAGLAAGAELTRSGLEVAIVEARDRLGGRVYTHRDRALAAPVELGAEFVHGKPQETWEIIAKAPLAACDVTGSRHVFRKGRFERGDDLFEKTGPIFEKMHESPDVPFVTFLETCGCDEDAKAWATAYVEGFNAAKKELVSTAALAFEEDAAERIDGNRLFRIISGYDRVVEWLHAAIDWRRATLYASSPVTRIRWTPGSVEVDTPRGTLKGRQAIITVPLGVLQCGAIRFEPEPDDVLHAAHRLQMGKVVRITLRFRERFWEERKELEDLSFMHSLEAPFPTWWTLVPLRAPVLTAWSAGPYAEQLAGANREAICEKALETLSRLLDIPGARLAGMLEDSFIHDWQADPHSRGAYSYVAAGASGMREALATPVRDTLYFAGEAANVEGHGGTVHGAIASGRRAGGEIAAKAKPASA